MDDYADRDAEPGVDEGDHFRAPLLLHSLAEFRELIFRCLDLADITSVAEIGAEDGHFTGELLRWSDGRGIRVVAIDPAPSPSLVELTAANPRLELIAATSLDAFEHMEPVEAYLIDGDHNYYTVSNELRLIEERAEAEFPIVFMHDVGWPCGRRDQYYAPDQIPENERHDYTYDAGVVPSNAGVVAGGFRGEGEFAVAVVEGGPRNGVLTAIDDFRSRRNDLEYATVPCVFGLGVLYPREASYADAVAGVLRRYEDEPLIDRLERNRLDLYLEILGLQAGHAEVVSQLSLALEQAKLHIRDLESENKALWARQHELEWRADRADEAQEIVRSQTDRLSVAVRKLLSETPYRVADAVARHKSSGRISRQDVEAILEELSD